MITIIFSLKHTKKRYTIVYATVTFILYCHYSRRISIKKWIVASHLLGMLLISLLKRILSLFISVHSFEIAALKFVLSVFPRNIAFYNPDFWSRITQNIFNRTLNQTPLSKIQMSKNLILRSIYRNTASKKLKYSCDKNIYKSKVVEQGYILFKFLKQLKLWHFEISIFVVVMCQNP